MKRVTKFLKWMLFVCLIILACFGVGLSGGVPIPNSSKRSATADVKTEIVERKKKDDKLKKGEFS
ncbi:MAG: hypothetical protein HKO66_04785 [Saprospiraceae bacterium]|nr:hypothetical protein [Bacteroidia bacterium]NNL91527.1 hypothetical protein [Saprospiraceae bacterium]